MIHEKWRGLLNDQRPQVRLDWSIHPLTEMMFVAGNQIMGSCKDRGGQDRRVLTWKDDTAGQKRSWDVRYQMGPGQQKAETGRMIEIDAIPLCLVDGVQRCHRDQVAHSPELEKSVVLLMRSREEDIGVKVDPQ